MAMGEWRQILVIVYDKLGFYVLQDIGSLPQQTRDMIMNDMECGIAHVQFETAVKFVLWDQLPLISHALAFFDRVRAAARMKEACAMFDVTEDCPRHSDVVRTLYAKGGEVRIGIDKFE